MSSRLQLSISFAANPRTWPLIDGSVTVDGVDLVITPSHPSEIFWRQLKFGDFDISEMSMSSLMMALAHGDDRFVGLPVFTTHRFFHTSMLVRRDAGIETPADLKGKRVGTSQYSSTGLVFMRGMLQHDYGVKSEDMHWFMGGLNSFVEPPLIPLNLPKAIALDFLREGETLEGLFAAGRLDALLSLYIPKLFLAGSPQISRLFPDYKAVEQDYYRRSGIFPIMHTVVVREDVHRAHPWVAKSIYQAFCAARDLAVDGLYDTDALRVALPWLIDHVEETWRVFGKDFWAYGLQANRPTFAAIGRYVHEQGLSPRVVDADELFLRGVE
jgi:4,5-dihydroxyphthalate decarboxylase